MFIPPSGYQPSTDQSRPGDTASVRLRSSHLWIAGELAEKAFGEEANIYLVFYPDRRSLLLAPVSNVEFKSIHKASQHILKRRNEAGDRSVAMHEILIDQELDDRDRTLDYDYQEGLGILMITI